VQLVCAHLYAELILGRRNECKVCSFPDGEDQIVLQKKTPFTNFLEYLEEEMWNFIQFKASVNREKQKAIR
jgi:DNA primase